MMTPERKAALIRGAFSLGITALVVGAGLWWLSPKLGFGRHKADQPRRTVQADPQTIKHLKAKKNCLVVIHCHQDGNPDSENLSTTLEELQRDKYGEVVKCAEVNVDYHPELAAQEGVTAENAPQLAFYVDGKRVGDYRGPWGKPEVERKIDEILHGYLERIGKDWLPKVQGMERANGQPIPPPRPRPGHS